jgi:hypothetical protein
MALPTRSRLFDAALTILDPTDGALDCDACGFLDFVRPLGSWLGALE